VCFQPFVEERKAVLSRVLKSESFVGAKASASTVDWQQQDDETLMQLYQEGAPEAFQVLFQRYQKRIFHYFLRSFREPEAASDLMQQTFLRIHRSRHDFEVTRSFEVWIFFIASNLRKDELKRRSRRPGDVYWSDVQDLVGRESKITQERQEKRPVTPEKALLTKERSEVLKAALAKLPESQREVIVLHKFQELSFPQIAEILGEKVEAVKSRAFRGYRALKRQLSSQQENYFQ
jgi:RNA polymerase sigma-70 factor (ECF subfamily)